MEWPNKQVNQEELIGGCKVALTLSDWLIEWWLAAMKCGLELSCKPAMKSAKEKRSSITKCRNLAMSNEDCNEATTSGDCNKLKHIMCSSDVYCV
jgi:hypothetical protein